MESITLGDLIGEGRTAEIYLIDEGTVLKLFRPGWPKENAEHEAEMAQAIAATGAPTPQYYGLVEAEDRYGVLYQRIRGPSLDVWIGKNPWRMISATHLMAETHLCLHARSPDGPPPLRQVLARRIERAHAPEWLREAALARLAALPDGTALCHGDFHPGNVLLGEDGPVVIDWDNATIGDPLADVARTLLLVRMAFTAQSSATQRQLMKQSLRLLSALYARNYRRGRPFADSEVEAWRLPVTVARLCEGITAEEPHLLARAHALVERAARNRLRI